MPQIEAKFSADAEVIAEVENLRTLETERLVYLRIFWGGSVIDERTVLLTDID